MEIQKIIDHLQWRLEIEKGMEDCYKKNPENFPEELVSISKAKQGVIENILFYIERNK